MSPFVKTVPRRPGGEPDGWWDDVPRVSTAPLKRFAYSGDMIAAHHKDRPQCRRNE